MVTSFRRFAALFTLLGSTAAAQLVTTNLQLEFNAGTDPQGDLVWTDTAGTVSPAQTLTFATPPVRTDISVVGSSYPALSVGYSTPAYGLGSVGSILGYFDQSPPGGAVRSTSNATFELWVNVTSLTAGNDQVIFEAGGEATGISFTLSNATLNFNVDGSGTTSDVTISKVLTTGMHHVVGVITLGPSTTTADDSLSLYVDGALVQTISNVNINDWAGGNICAIGGVGQTGNSITGVTTPINFHGQIAAVRYYNRALTAAQVAQNTGAYSERLATYVTGQSSTNNYAVTTGSGFTPTKTRTIGGVLYGFNHVTSDGTDGLVASQFKSWDLYTSADNGSTWTFVKTMIDRTDPALTNTIFQSIQFAVTPAGFVGLYMKNLYAVTPQGATDNRKFLTCIFSETPTGTYRVAFDQRPFGQPSGDLGSVTTGGQLYLVSANTTDGYINIFNVGARGDSLVGHTLKQQWLLPDGTVDFREAPSLFWQGGYWFLTTSGRTGWRPNQHKYAYATGLAGPWSPLINLGDSTGYHSQLFFVGTAGSNRIFSATRNAPQWGGEGGSQPVWLPMRFNRVPDILATNFYDEVDINYTTGTVEGFHYDRGRQIPVTKATVKGYPTDDASAIVDGDEATSWSNTAANGTIATDKRTIDLALGSVNLVKALKIKPLDEWRWTYKVKIYVGDGTTFTQVFPKGSEPPIIPNYAFLGPIDVTPTSGSVVRIENYASYQEGSTNNRFGLYEVQVWGGTSSAGAELTESFATYPSNWVTSAQSGTTASVVTLPGDASPSLRLTDTSAANRVEVSKSFSAQNGSRVLVEWKYRTDNAGTGEFLRLYQGGSIALNLVNSPTIAAASGFTTLAQTDNAGAETGIQQISLGAWHVFRLEVNTDTDTFDLYIDGNLAWLGGKLRNPVTALEKIMVGTTSQAVNVSAYFDDISIDGPNPAGNTATLDQTEQLLQQVADLQYQIAAQQASIASLQTQYTTLDTNYNTLNAQYSARTAEVASLRASLDAALADVTSLRAALAAAQADAAASRTALDAARADNARLQTALNAAQAEVTSLRASLATAQTDAATLRTALDAARAESVRLQTALDTAQTEISALRAALSSAQTEAATLRASLVAAQTEATSLRTNLADVTTRLATAESALAAAQVSVQSLQTSLTAANAQNATLTTEKTQLTSALADAVAARQALTTEVATVTASLADTAARLTAAESAFAQAQASIQSLQTSLQAANVQNANLTAEGVRLTAQLADANAAKQALGVQVAALTVSLAETTSRLTAAEASLAQAQTSVQSLQVSLQTANTQIATLTADKNHLSVTLAATTATVQTLTTQVSSMNSSLLAIAALLGRDNGDSNFKLPGGTLEAQLSALMEGINSLNHGQKQALFKALGGKP